MDMFVVQVVAAFLIFAVLLPLAGFLVGCFCYYVLPYLLGGVAMLVLAAFVGSQLLLSWWAWLFALVWGTSVHFIRRSLQALGCKVEHHHAAHYMLLAGIPFHRKRNRLSQALAEC